ncbi:PREDICTED: transmembrane protein 244 isoform X3 [Myotis brandtii]|uniref:transmembrane protein 244 isoform X3 n=1 Tax=Myotis brandtii TaxID=109478 RepID=UPI000704473D|nr:PREDICTED: transmembrane protein 244 isoform X3 [Myotis brandtii]
MEKLEVTIASSSRCRPHKERGSHHLIDIGCDMALQVRVAPRKKRLVTNNHVKKPRLWSSRLSSLQVVLQNLLKCVILFYTVYYVVLSLGCRALRVDELDVLAPFDFKTNPAWANYNVLLVSTEVTYFICGLLFILVVEEWVWDYAISVTVLHVAITSTDDDLLTQCF